MPPTIVKHAVPSCKAKARDGHNTNAKGAPRGSPKPYDRMTHGQATVRGRDPYDVTFWDTRKKVHPPATRLDPTRRSSTGDLLDQGDYMYDPYRRPSPPTEGA